MKVLLDSHEQVLAYLRRIGLDVPVETDLNGLNTLIQAQLTHVPFEALDIWGTGVCPSLEICDLFQKIVINKRGGYCFELNTLFRVLLNSLGFDAYQAIASLLDNNGIAAPPAHNVIICTISGQKYLVDVGFGGPVPFGAMAMTDVVQDGFRLDRQGDFYILKRIETAGERFIIRFRDLSAEPVELLPLNFYTSQKPDVLFRQILHVNQRQADGSVYTVMDREFRIHRGEETIVRELRNMEDVKEVLRDYFHMDPDTIPLRQKR